MSRTMIELQHHLCSGCCMWSGIEDVYVTKTGEQVPEAFFFCMASSGETVYLKMKDAHKERMLSFGDGRTKVTYDRLKRIIGLNYRISGGRTYEYALKSILREVDQGNPVILGPLDMYELPYLKMYHHDHIPMHYVLMVGYDEELQKIYIYDCDRTELQELSYEQLRLAWNIEKNVVGDKNGFIRFSLSDDTPGVEEIASRSLQRKAKEQLTEKPYMIGASAFKKIAKEFPKWRQQMSEEMYRSTLKYLTEFWGTVPKLPNRLLGINDQKDIHYCGGLDRFGSCLMIMGNSYQKNNWTAAGTLFQHAGERIEQVTDLIIRYLCDGEDERKRIPQLFLETGELIQKAYEQIGQEDEIR